jgi:hypothetical protein
MKQLKINLGGVEYISKIVKTNEPSGYLNSDQIAVINLIQKEGPLTLARSVEVFGRHIYANAEKHIGTRLSRMVKRGFIIRAEKGVFILPPITDPKTK